MNALRNAVTGSSSVGTADERLCISIVRIRCNGGVLLTSVALAALAGCVVSRRRVSADVVNGTRGIGGFFGWVSPCGLSRSSLPMDSGGAEPMSHAKASLGAVTRSVSGLGAIGISGV